MSTPDNHIDLTDFTADVAARTGESEETLTRRASTDPAEDILWAKVRHRPDYELRAEKEAFATIVSQYSDERRRLFRWFGSDQDWDPQSELLNPIVGEKEGFAPPSAEEIAEALAENPELYAEKIRQGFTRLLIVPEGGHLAWMFDGYTRALAEIAERDLLDEEYRDSVGYEAVRVSLDRMVTTELWGYVDEESHDLQTKEERVQANGRTAAWRAYLIQDIAENGLKNPLTTEKALVMPGHTLMVATQRGGEFDWSVLGSGLTEGEVGLTPEAYVALSMQYLLEHDDLLDTEYPTALLGVRARDEWLGIPYMSRDSKKHKLAFSISDRHLHKQGSELHVVHGVRTAVPIRIARNESEDSA